jgi:hypothetical protein
VSGELPTRNFVLARAKKVTTTARSHINKLPSLKNFRPIFATIVDNSGIMSINARTLGGTSPIHRGKAPEQIRVIPTKKPTIQVKQNQLNFMGIISTREHHPYDLPSLIVL